MWSQGYDPLGSAVLSTLLAGAPVIVLLGMIGWLRWKAHHAALVGLATALAIAMFAFRLPPLMAVSAAVYGAAYGFFPIGWIVLNALSLYNFSNDTGAFKILRESLSAVTPDRRLQVLLVAFSFGAFMEGGAGFSAPVAVSAAMLIGLGFPPLAASGVALVANTMCVPFGSLGVPEVTLAAVSGLDLLKVTIATGWLLVPFCLIIPFWTVAVFSGFRGLTTIWPAALVAGISYAIPHQLVALYQGPWLVSVIASVVSLGTLIAFLRVWKPGEIWTATGAGGAGEPEVIRHTPREILRAWTPWIILTLTLLVWGIPQVARFLGGMTTVAFQVPTLHNLVQRVPPAVAVARLEPAVFNLNWLTATGTAIMVATIIGSLVMGYPLRRLAGTYWRTIKAVRFALLTISTMVAIGFTTRYAGMDATLGLAFAGTGALYPFFGTLVGYLGVASTGSIASSNALFGSQQVITADSLGLNPMIMASANPAGGAMAKMVSAQSIVIASTATNWHGHESDILRHLFFHSLALVCLMGLWVMAMAYIPGLAALVPRP